MLKPQSKYFILFRILDFRMYNLISERAALNFLMNRVVGTTNLNRPTLLFYMILWKNP